MLNLSRLILVIALFPATANAAEVYVPEDLEQWQGWVLQGEEYRECPFFFASAASQRNHFVCAWPGKLEISVGSDGGRFTQRWTVYAQEQWLPLPGDAAHWPHQVTVNGQSVEVTAPNDKPRVRLSPGNHRIAGRWEWDERPGVLRVPKRTGLISLTVDGRPVERPEIDRGGVFLGERKRDTQARDAVQADVYRLVADEVPTILTTMLQIDVSGGVREELFGPILPAGFVPLTLDSQLPARLEADGKLRLQVRPGRWQITLAARAPGVLDQITLPSPETNLPGTEIWSYRSNDRLRVTAAEGLPPVDPSQMQVPDPWMTLPAFRIEPGQSLEISERSRGIVAADNELTLDRTMWLDYDGGGFVVADKIQGTMRTGWRLDMSAPYDLLSATESGESLLITQGLEPGQTGIEVRQSDVSVQSIGRSETRKTMPVTGWEERFAQVQTALNLPPGHKLLGAPGADRAPGSWVSRWQLLDFFLVLIITIAAWKLLGRSAGIIALLAVVLSFHEIDAPGWLWLNLLVAIALFRVAPAGRLRQAVQVYQGLSILALLVVLIPFMASQLRIAIYPQLEAQYGVAARLGRAKLATPQTDLPDRREEERKALAVVSESPVEEIVVAASKGVRRYSRYAPNAIVQAGPGIPSWQWNTYHLGWSGPIDADQTVKLVILPRWLVTVLRFVAVGLLLLFSAILAAEILGKRWTLPGGLSLGGGKAAGIAVVVAAAMGMLLAASPQAEAQTPDPKLLEQLKARLLKAPDCVPRCAEIASANIVVGRNSVSVDMTVHAMQEVALPLPGSAAGWRPEAISVGGSSAAQVLRRGNEQLWLRVDPGRHRVELRGSVPAVDSLEIPFPSPPRFLVARSDHWLIAGVKDRRLLSGSLQLTRLRTEQESGDAVRWESSRFPAFVQVERTIDLDLDWQVTTKVTRIAPAQGALTLDLPLVNGETVLTDNFAVDKGRILVSMGPSQQAVSWRSNLPRESPLILTAEAGSPWREVWRIGAGSIWHADFSGVPESETGLGASDVRIAEFHPRDGESLTVDATRPEASEGSTLAFDSVSLQTQVGSRSRDVSLELAYRSTRGSQHAITLPSTAEVTAVSIDGQIQPLRADAGQLTLPIVPGEHAISISWRETANVALSTATPVVDIGAPSGNIKLGLQLPADRWLLATGGPRLGPGVLYWSELAVLVLFAVILGRVKLAPLNTLQWLLLGLGFSMFSWPALGCVVVWLLACGVRERWRTDVNWWRFDAIQVAIGALTLVAIASIVGSLPMGLLGSPDMHVAGNNSFGNTLNWFADRSDSVLPVAHAISVPMWIYKIAILAWALWLSFALLRWLKWAWRCFSSEGYWRSPKTDALKAE
jgi:hypothetical protein